MLAFFNGADNNSPRLAGGFLDIKTPRPVKAGAGEGKKACCWAGLLLLGLGFLFRRQGRKFLRHGWVLFNQFFDA